MEGVWPSASSVIERGGQKGGEAAVTLRSLPFVARPSDRAQKLFYVSRVCRSPSLFFLAGPCSRTVSFSQQNSSLPFTRGEGEGGKRLLCYSTVPSLLRSACLDCFSCFPSFRAAFVSCQPLLTIAIVPLYSAAPPCVCVCGGGGVAQAKQKHTGLPLPSPPPALGDDKDDCRTTQPKRDTDPTSLVITPSSSSSV